MAVKWTSVSPCSHSSFSPSSVCLEPAGDPESLERSMQQRASCLQSSNFRLRWIRAQWSHWIDLSHLFIVWLHQWKFSEGTKHAISGCGQLKNICVGQNLLLLSSILQSSFVWWAIFPQWRYLRSQKPVDSDFILCHFYQFCCLCTLIEFPNLPGTWSS